MYSHRWEVVVVISLTAAIDRPAEENGDFIGEDAACNVESPANLGIGLIIDGSDLDRTIGGLSKFCGNSSVASLLDIDENSDLAVGGGRNCGNVSPVVS